ncbi:hypothetical protein [Rhodococcoides fascians]|uniref:hypothetical protein n=1 Tax=Rhodococcoides fascians TaxID=1828 RepID=UPI00055CDE87|nr:hypothetical protein [Rhodococcus fascians]
MTRDDVWDLLTGIAAFDQRTVGQSDVDVWFATVGSVPIEDAVEAVVIHHKTSPDRIKPFHVVDGARRLANDRVMRLDAEGRAQREDSRDRRLRLVGPDEQLGALPIAADGDPVPGAYDVNGAVDRPCPKCGAEEMSPCVNVRSGEPRRIPCLERLTGKARL